jgi:hypothetical protein
MSTTRIRCFDAALSSMLDVSIGCDSSRRPPDPPPARCGVQPYYAVPDNIDAVAAFRTQVARHWYRALRRRSQRNRLDWKRMNRLVVR